MNPPSEWVAERRCPREECDETRFTPIGMELHLIRDHGGKGGIRTPAEQVADV